MIIWPIIMQAGPSPDIRRNWKRNFTEVDEGATFQYLSYYGKVMVLPA